MELLDSMHGDSSVTYPTTTADSISEDDEFSSPDIGAYISPLYPRPSALVKQPTFRYIKTTVIITGNFTSGGAIYITHFNINHNYYSFYNLVQLQFQILPQLMALFGLN